MVEYDPFSPAAMSDPHPIYRRLRDLGPVYPLPDYDAFALPRFSEVWEVAQDRAHFSIFEGPVFAKDALLQHRGVAPPPIADTRPWPAFSSLDPPLHTRVRQVLFSSFTPHACRAKAPGVRALVADQLEALAGRREFDLIRDYAGPVALAATLQFLDLPTDDAARLGVMINTSTRRDPGQPGTSAAGAKARAELQSYLIDHVERTRSSDTGVISRLVDFDTGGDPLSDAEVAAQISTLLVGGAETLPKIIAGGVARLADHRDQRAELIADRGLIPGAFEEMVRLEGVLQFVGRTLTKPVTIGGQAMTQGQRVLLLLQSANRDEREFDEPESFQIRRKISRQVGFGHGVHFCIGAHQARAVGWALLEGLFATYPDFAVDVALAERPPSEFQIGYTSMPLHTAT